VALLWDTFLDSTFPGAPAWQTNSANLRLEMMGGTLQATSPTTVRFAPGALGELLVFGQTPGLFWDLLSTTSPLIPRLQAAFETSDGQVLNLDSLAPDFAATFNLFQGPPLTNLRLPFTAPPTLELSLQAALLDPSRPSGLTLSQPIRASGP